MVADNVKRFAHGHWSFLGPVRNSHAHNSDGEWADIALINFSESGHHVFRGSSVFEMGDLKVVHTFQWQRRNRRSDL